MTFIDYFLSIYFLFTISNDISTFLIFLYIFQFFLCTVSHYATLYFVFVVDSAESELAILDIIQVFVETLDKSFENVCELDMIFHSDEVFIFIYVFFQFHYILDEIIQGGLVLNVDLEDLQNSLKEIKKISRK